MEDRLADSMIELRRAGPDDAAAIRQLTREAYARWVPLIGREPRPMTADYDAALRSHRFDLLYLESALVGLIETIDEGDALLVENVAVAPAFQGRGLGSRLMAHAEDIARALGRSRLRLYTNKRFEANVRLYLRLGYQVDGETDLGGGAIRIDMSKALAPLATPHRGSISCR
jgi:GNAT superfamily N-acetyltransferase